MTRSSRIVLFPEPVLRAPCRSVAEFDDELLSLVSRLDHTMRAQRHGIGIAAPQIGVAVRVALVDVSSRVPGSESLVLVNPEILSKGGVKLSREGCMSLPDYTADLKRYEWVVVRWQDETGLFHEKKCEGIEAVCVQHEVDHLNGVLFLDRVSCLKTDMYPRGTKSIKK